MVLAFARGLGEFGATLLFAGSQAGRRTLAVQLYLLHEQPDDAAERRLWRLAAAAVVLSCAALAASFVSGCASKSTFSGGTATASGKQSNEGTNSGAAAVQPGEFPTNSTSTISKNTRDALVATVQTAL